MFKFTKIFSQRKKIQKDLKFDRMGRAIIDISINDKDEVLSPFGIDNQKIINEDFAAVLDNTSKSIHPNQKLNLRIRCNNITENEKVEFAKATKNYYTNKVLDAQTRLKNNYKIIFFCSVMSVISLLAFFLSFHFNFNSIIKEVVEIIAWVFVWEAVDLLAFESNLIKFEKRRYEKLLKSKISFVKD